MLLANIKKLRKKHHLSQEQLAQKTGITYSTYIKIESGLNKNSRELFEPYLQSVFANPGDGCEEKNIEDAIEKIYEQKIFDLEELKKSVLKKAFNGEL